MRLFLNKTSNTCSNLWGKSKPPLPIVNPTINSGSSIALFTFMAITSVSNTCAFIPRTLLNYTSDQEPVDLPPSDSDTSSEYSEDEDAYNLAEVSSDVEVEVDTNEADLEEDARYVSVRR